MGTLIVFWKQLRAAHHALRGKAILDTLEILEGKDNIVRELRRVLRGAIQQANAAKRQFDFHSLTPDEQKQVDQLAREYDKMGLLVKHGAIPINIVFDFYSKPIVQAWEALQGHITEERKARNQPGHMRKFETLAIGAALHRNQQHSEHPPMPDKHQIKEWNRWKTWRS